MRVLTVVEYVCTCCQWVCTFLLSVSRYVLMSVSTYVLTVGEYVCTYCRWVHMYLLVGEYVWTYCRWVGMYLLSVRSGMVQREKSQAWMRYVWFMMLVATAGSPRPMNASKSLNMSQINTHTVCLILQYRIFSHNSAGKCIVLNVNSL